MQVGVLRQVPERDETAGRQTLDNIRFIGDAFVTDTATICKLWSPGVRT